MSRPIAELVAKVRHELDETIPNVGNFIILLIKCADALELHAKTPMSELAKTIGERDADIASLRVANRALSKRIAELEAELSDQKLLLVEHTVPLEQFQETKQRAEAADALLREILKDHDSDLSAAQAGEGIEGGLTAGQAIRIRAHLAEGGDS